MVINLYQYIASHFQERSLNRLNYFLEKYHDAIIHPTTLDTNRIIHPNQKRGPN